MADQKKAKKKTTRANARKRGRPRKPDSEKVRSMPAAERRPAVLKLKIQGYTPEEIAHKLRLRPTTVRADLKRMADETARETPDKVVRRREQDARLELLWRAVQPAVDATHVQGIKVALQVLERQAKLNGLDVDPKATVTLVAPTRTEWDRILSQETPRAALGFDMAACEDAE